MAWDSVTLLANSVGKGKLLLDDGSGIRLEWRLMKRLKGKDRLDVRAPGHSTEALREWGSIHRFSLSERETRRAYGMCRYRAFKGKDYRHG